MPTIAIYARKSSESEDRQILSIDSQIRELKEFALKQGLLVSAVHAESKSAKAPGRPIFSELVGQIQKKKVDGILCWKLDRLARNPVDGGAVIWAMEEGHLQAIHTPQRTFLNTGNDKFWMQLEFGMAKKFVDDLSDNVKRGLRAKISQGWMPGLPPLGYLNDRNTHTVIKDPERFPVVRKVWDLVLTGNYTPRKALDVATDQWGLRTRKFTRVGGGPVQYSAIYKILTNPFYYGAILYNGELSQGAHEPMITKKEFDRVQELLGQSNRPRPKEHSFAFTGMMKCGECGAAITAEHKTNRQGHKYVYYHCTKRKRSVRCNQRVIERAVLEQQITMFLASLTINEEIRDWTVALLRDLHQDERQKDVVTLQSLQRRYESGRKEIGELVNMRLRGLLDDSEYISKKSDLEQEQFRLRELLDDSDTRFQHVLEACEDAFEFAYTAKLKFENGTFEEKRAILSYTGSNLIFLDGILRIVPQKPLQLIQRALLSPDVKKMRFEPAISTYSKAKTAPLGSGTRNWLSLVKDVRTFFWKNTSLPTFKQTLARMKEIPPRHSADTPEIRQHRKEKLKEQRAIPRLHKVYQRRAQSPDLPVSRKPSGAGRTASPTGPTSVSSSRYARRVAAG